MDITNVQIPGDDDIDLEDVVQMATKELLDSRKQELSKSIAKLFYKADQLATDQRKAEKDVVKLGEKLEKTLKQIDKLKKGDWSVLKEIDDKGKDKNPPNHPTDRTR